MDGSGPVNCPALPFERFHSNLVVSDSSRVVGNVVEFSCSGKDQVVSGPTFLQCTTTGKWNGTIPTCVHSDEVTILSPTSTTQFNLSTTVTEEPPVEVETVIIVLWITGGLLLITLSILIGCILRNHKKERRNRQEQSRQRGPGDPRHGGVNPTFTTYDEIWTWIPVVTNNTDQCRSQPDSASTQENRLSRTNNELLQNLRLPTYSEAIHSATNNRQNVSSACQNRTAVSSALNSNRNASQTTVHRTGLQNTPSAAQVTARVENGARIVLSQNTTDTNHYETIPADNVALRDSTVSANAVTHMRGASNSVSGSALQQARDFVDRVSAQAPRPAPSAPEYSSRTGGMSNGSRHNENRVSAHAQRPAPSAPEYSSRTGGMSNETRHNERHHPARHFQPIQSANIAISSSQHDTRHHSSSRQNSSQPSDFRHSEGSVFSHYDQNRRRGSDIGPPPPYQDLRPNNHRVPVMTSRNSSSGRMTSQTSASMAAVALNTGIESQYF